MKSKPKLFTLRRGLAAVMCASMITSVVNITTIGLAYTQLPESVDIALYQQVGNTTEVASDTRDAKPGDPLKYHIEAKIKVPEEVAPDTDTNDNPEDNTASNEQTESRTYEGSEGSLFNTDSGGNPEGDNEADDSSNTGDTTVDPPSGNNDQELPSTTPRKYNAYITLHTDTLFESGDTPSIGFSAVSLSDLKEIPVSWERIDSERSNEYIFKCKEVSENCQVSISVPGIISESTQEGTSLRAFSTLQLVPLKEINSELVEQAREELKTSNDVYTHTSLSYGINGRLACNNLTLDVAAQEFEFTITKSKDGKLVSVDRKYCKPDYTFIAVDEEYSEEGTYVYVVKQEKLNTTDKYNIKQDTTEYVIEKRITRDMSTGNLNETSCTITKDGEPYNSKELLFTNSVEETVVPKPGATKSVQLTGKVVAGKAQLKGGEFTFTLTPGVAVYKDTEDDEEEVAAYAYMPDIDSNTTPPEDIGGSESNGETEIDNSKLPPIPSGLEPLPDNDNNSNDEDSNNSNTPDNNDNTGNNTADNIGENTNSDSDQSNSSSDSDTSAEEQSGDSTTGNKEMQNSDEAQNEQSDVSETNDGSDVSDNSDTDDQAIYESSENSFESTLEDDAPLAPMNGVSPAPTDGKLKTTNTASGNFSFGEIEFDRPGVYQYEISQDPTDSGYKNNQKYTATVTVDTTNDSLANPKVTLKDAYGVAATALVFDNDESAVTPDNPDNPDNPGTSVPNVAIEATQSTSEGGTYSKEPVKVKDGGNVYYRVTIKNNGTAGANDTTINVPIPEGMTYVQGSGGNGVNVHSSSLSWTVKGSFASGKDISCSFQLRLPSSTSATSWTVSPYVTYSNNPNNFTNDLEHVLSNELTVQREGGGGSSGNVSSTGLEVNVMQARNNESASTSNITVYSGDKIKYTVTVTNRGESDVNNISVTVEFPSGLRVQSSDVGSNGVISNNNILWNLDKLEAGKSVSYSFTGTVDAVTSSKDLAVRATAYPSNNTSQISTSNTVTAQAFAASSYQNMQITIKQSLDSLRNATDKDLQVKAGDEVTYYITVQNTSNNASQKVTISDTVPSGMEVVANSISDNGTASNGKVTWELDSIPANSNKTVSFTVKIPETGTSWDNAATLNIQGDSGNGTKSNTVKATVNSTGLSISLTQALNSGSSTTEDITVLQNDTITYSFTVTNATSSEATDVIVTDTIPSLFTIEEDSITTGGSANGNTITWNIGNIPANSRYTVGVRVKSGTTGNGSKHINKGTVKYRTGGTDNSVDSNKVTAVFQVSGIPYQPQEQTPTINEPTTPAPTIQENTSNYTPEVDASLFKVGGKIPQTGGFTELHMWIFLFIVSGGGLILMSFTGKKHKHAW